MEYRIARGQEHKLVLSSDIYNKDQFMYEAYCEARNALAEIVRYSSEISSRGSDSNMMFEALQNIIAFSGKRGQGKTSTMLSFSQALQKKQVTDAAIEKCSFVVLDPIDPTILEKNQNILALILSRMYGHAETVWNKVSAQSFGYNNRRPTEADKNELLSLFQRCLNGINAIKCKKEAEIKSLNDISVVSDSATQMHVCVNTDDLGVFDTSLSFEYALLADALSQQVDANGNHIYSQAVILRYLDDIREMGLNAVFSKPDQR